MYIRIISMDIEMASQAFKALGDPTRLRILQTLSGCPDQLGETKMPTAGEVCCLITGAETITSTVSHHLKALREAGLIRMERHGKTMCCCPDRVGILQVAKLLESIAIDSACCSTGETNA
ncbi:MAG: helix-turn-helix transcriptional regulator [Fimbriimonadaceae bacterium]|nr:helix-turn-helix transcriptional regulator [Fimbriimonadaceae bacterium]